MSPHDIRDPHNVADLDPQSFGAQLRRLRKEAGLNQRDLGAAIGREQTRISQYERGVYMPNEETIFALARVLNVDPAMFFETKRFGYVRTIGAERWERVRELEPEDWRVLDHVINALNDATPEERAVLEQGVQRFLESLK